MLNLPVPEAEFINEVLKPSEEQQEMVSAFSERAESVRGGLVNPTEDNMLKITNDGRKCALDQRLLNELLPDAEKSKVNTCVENAFQVWDEGKTDRTTQLIFCDLSTPKGDGTFNVYDDVRNKLVARGIPKEEIAFIHEYNTEAKKAELFAKVRAGQVRILMGSTPKLGAGTNVQDRLIALHHLDCPWKPSDLEQQEGRILRQGNQNDKVKIFRYVTENTFDAYMWQILENKQKFISQIMTSKSPVRACEDVDDTALSYAEIKALATGNPYIKEKMDLDVQVSKLKLLKANHTSQIYRLESDIAKNFPVQISALKERIAGMQIDSQIVKSVDLQDNDTFTMTVGNVLYEDKKEAGEALIAACAGLKTVSTGGKVGEYHGFTLSASYNMFSNAFELTVKGKCSYKLEIGKDPVGNMQRIHNTLSSIDRKLTESVQKLETVQQQLVTAQEEVKKPFPKEAELNEKMERLSELNALLNMDEKGNETIMADEDIGREGGSTDSRDAVEEKELPETADRIHKPSILERLKQEKAQQNTAEQPPVQKAAKKKHEQEL
ncbi:DNA methylase [uncultured Ruminococcus sp.]|nr:DNA methylase [uncultured Ruminococcus sp.]